MSKHEVMEKGMCNKCRHIEEHFHDMPLFVCEKIYPYINLDDYDDDEFTAVDINDPEKFSCIFWEAADVTRKD